MALRGGGGVVADHEGSGTDEGSVDGGEEVGAAGESVAAGVAGSGLAGGAAEEDVVEERKRLGRGDAACRGEAEGEIGALLIGATSKVFAAISRSRSAKIGGRGGPEKPAAALEYDSVCSLLACLFLIACYLTSFSIHAT